MANTSSNSVSVIDTATNSVVRDRGRGRGPDIDVNRVGTRVYVANGSSNNVSVIETMTNTVVATVAVGNSPAAFGKFIGPKAEHRARLNAND